VELSGQLTSSALQAMLQDGKFAGSWTLDTARSEVRLTTRHTWGLRPLHGVFRQVTGNGTVTAAGDASTGCGAPARLGTAISPARTCGYPWLEATRAA